jgi:uncharacterized protein YbaR (Trm112 family)
VAVYVICPHCGHPSVLSRLRTGKGRYCRQCARLYFVEESASLAAEAMALHSPQDVAFLSRRSTFSTLVPVLEIA